MMMLWFVRLCCEVQHRHVQETNVKCSCATGAQTTRCTAALLCLAPGPSALSGEARLVRRSWGSGTAAWHASNILKAAGGKAVEPGKHGHPRRLGLTSTSGGPIQHGRAVILAASAARGCSIASPGTPKGPLPAWRWLVLLEMSQGIPDFVAWDGDTWHKACGSPTSSWRKSWEPGRDPTGPMFWQLNCALCISI